MKFNPAKCLHVVITPGSYVCCYFVFVQVFKGFIVCCFYEYQRGIHLKFIFARMIIPLQNSEILKNKLDHKNLKFVKFAKYMHVMTIYKVGLFTSGGFRGGGLRGL